MFLNVGRAIENLMQEQISIAPGTMSSGAIAALLFKTGLIGESATDTITAFAGGGQTNAVALTTEVNRITTVATTGDSVKLPPSVPGATIWVVNHGANPMQVYGSGTDQIDDVASGTGVQQMQGSTVLYTCITAGNWYTEGLATGYSGSLMTMSTVNSLTAHAGGGQGSATPLTAMINRVTTVATIADSVVLPAAAAGLSLTVVNAAANSLNMFSAGTDQINALGASTAFALAGGKTVEVYCTNAGQWHTILSA